VRKLWKKQKQNIIVILSYFVLFGKKIPILRLFLQDLEFTLSCTYFLCLLLKKVALLFCHSEPRETSQIFSRTFQDSKKSRTFPECGNPGFRAWQLWINRVAILTDYCCGNETDSELPSIKTSTFIWDQRCAGSGVQESTPVGVSVFPKERSRTGSGYFWLKQDPKQEWFIITVFLR